MPIRPTTWTSTNLAAELRAMCRGESHYDAPERIDICDAICDRLRTPVIKPPPSEELARIDAAMAILQARVGAATNQAHDFCEQTEELTARLNELSIELGRLRSQAVT